MRTVTSREWLICWGLGLNLNPIAKALRALESCPLHWSPLVTNLTGKHDRKTAHDLCVALSARVRSWPIIKCALARGGGPRISLSWCRASRVPGKQRRRRSSSGEALGRGSLSHGQASLLGPQGSIRKARTHIKGGNQHGYLMGSVLYPLAEVLELFENTGKESGLLVLYTLET